MFTSFVDAKILAGSVHTNDCINLFDKSILSLKAANVECFANSDKELPLETGYNF